MKTIENVRDTFYTYWKGQEISNALDKIASIFQSASEPLSLKQFDELYLSNSNEKPYQVHRIIKRLEDFGILLSEKRKEEFITKEVEEWVVYNKEKQVIPPRIWATLDSGEKIEIDNPLYYKMKRYGRWEYVEKKIQVTRKYYTWVG